MDRIGGAAFYEGQSTLVFHSRQRRIQSLVEIRFVVDNTVKDVLGYYTWDPLDVKYWRSYLTCYIAWRVAKIRRTE